MSLIKITGAVAYPVTVADVMENGRVDSNDEDGFLGRLIAAGTAYAEQRTGQKFTSQVWELVLDAFPEDDEEIVIDLGPVSSVTSVKYLDADGVEQTLGAGDYVVDTASLSARISAADGWPATQDGINSVRVRFAVGTTPPEDVKDAIILWVEARNENRSGSVTGQSVANAPITIEMLLSLHSRVFV